MGAMIVQHALVYGSVPLLVEGSVARLELSSWAETGSQLGASAAEILPGLEVCRFLQGVVRVARKDMQGLQLVFTLEWKGGYEEDRIRLLESTTYRLEMEALVAWKAIGSV